MRKADWYESFFLFNRGIDGALRGLRRLRHTKECDLDAKYLDEKVILLELHRASLNGFFCSSIGRTEEHDVVRFEKKHREYENTALDEVQVYRDLIAVEERRRIEGKSPKVRFLTDEEQARWERQYPRPSENAGCESPQNERRDP